MRILLDTDVILDLLLEREPFVDDAAALWKANEQGRFEAYISAITPINIFYIVRKIKGKAIARQAVSEIIAAFRICPLDLAVLQNALSLPLSDYEDAVQHAAAEASLIDAIVTRNLKDYQNATIRIFSPADFLQYLNTQPTQ